MIIFLISLILFLIGLAMLHYVFVDLDTSDFMVSISCFLSVVFGITTLITLLMIIATHCGVDVDIEKSRIEYDSLVKRYEIINSDYEDMSKSDVIKDIAEWNERVYSEKYWSVNPWTSWFYSRRYADTLNYIDIGEAK